MFSILEQNSEKGKVKLSLFNNFNNSNDWTNSLVIEIYNVDTASSTWFKNNENILNFKNFVLFLKNIFNSDEIARILSV